MAFAHTVKSQAYTAAAWVAVQRKNFPKGDPDDDRDDRSDSE